MWNFKKIVFIVLALLPVAPLLLMLVTGIFDSDFTIDQLRWGDCNITVYQDTVTVSYSSNCIVELLLGAFVRSGHTFRGGTILQAIFTALSQINTALGWDIDIMPVVIISVFYLLYYVLLYFVNLLIDLITLIPRLCERLFNV